MKPVLFDCAYCGQPCQRQIVCPECDRDGCDGVEGVDEGAPGFTGCMPAGRNCMCPECEEARS